MSTSFRADSIRWQIAALAVGPVISLVILGGVSASVLRGDFESVSYAQTTALRIEMVIDQVRASASPAQEAAILDVVSRTGLQVEEVSPAELTQQGGGEVPAGDVRRLVRDNLPPTFKTAIQGQTATGKLGNALVVGFDHDRALAFLPSPPPPDPWMTDRQVSLALQLLALVLPVVLLSLYAAAVITAPLLKFAKAAETLKPDEGPDRPFDESGAAEIRTLAKSLNDMRSRVRSMIDDRTRILRAISHDLRTPLTRLRLRVERSTEPDLKETLLKDISALNGMINDTLTYLSKETAAEEPVNADLPSLLATVCADFADIGFNVKYAGLDRFAYRCKPQALGRAIVNLIENSTRYAEEIVVELSVVENGTVRISVEDDGPGLSGNLRNRVLEPFFKVDTARTLVNRSGFGLGLSIVDDIVRAHGGTIEFLNRTPHGLLAQINLPSR